MWKEFLSWTLLTSVERMCKRSGFTQCAPPDTHKYISKFL